MLILSEGLNQVSESEIMPVFLIKITEKTFNPFGTFIGVGAISTLGGQD